MIGQTISHYKILEKLGEGGMGIVYKAHDTTLDRIVALKFLPNYLTSDAKEKERFYHEARAASALMHSNITVIHEISEDDGPEGAGRLFLAMEYIEGRTLKQLIEKDSLLVNKALDIAIQACDGLSAAHEKGIVHRDVKSDNIMITPKGQVKIMDFGLAKVKGATKLTRAGSTLGTAAYMSPEQAQGEEVDNRSDLFSFGVVLYELLTGKLPFRGEHQSAMMYSLMNEDPQPIARFNEKVSPELERIVSKALAKERDERYQHGEDLLADLRRERKSIEYAKAGYSTVSSPPPSLPSSKSKRNSLVIGISALAVVALGLYLIFARREQAIDSLAILPFENVGGSAEQEYLADGVTESIINNLTKIASLRVVPRSTVFRFKGKEMDIQAIGSKLGVSVVLSGRITLHGQALDVQVDLIDIKRESQLWGNRYQLNAADLITLQERITSDVSSKLGIGLSAETREKLAKRSTDNTRAYQLYLQGRFYWNKRTAVALERAIDFFKQAIALDSSYALAYAGLADTYLIQSQYSGIPAQISVPRAQLMVRRALKLDNSLAEAHTTLAFSYFVEWKYEDAEREFKQAISLNPRYPTAYHWYNLMLVRTGRVDEASAMVQKAYDLDPYSPIITLNMGVIPFVRRQFEEALLYFKKCVELDPSFAVGYAWTGRTLEREKKYQDALPQLQKALELSGRSSECLGYLGFFYGRTGKRDEALKLLKETEDRYRAGTGAAFNIARIYAGLGEKDKTLQWLELDYRDRSTWINTLLIDYAWDDVRSDPRFVELIKKVGLQR